MAISDVKTFGAMFASIPAVTNIITRYSILEKLYLQSDFERRTGIDSQLLTNLREAIIVLYAALLVHLHTVNRYFEQSKISQYLSHFPLRVNLANRQKSALH
jgi:hypothetical protein